MLVSAISGCVASFNFVFLLFDLMFICQVNVQGQFEKFDCVIRVK